MARLIHTHFPAVRFKSEGYRDIEKKVEAASRHEAFVLFENAKKRLNDINNWQMLCGKTPAEFALTDARGNALTLAAPRIGDMIRVRCFDNGSDDFVWYRIMDFISERNLLKDTEDFGFRVARVSGPASSTSPAGHDGVTCTFVVTRSGCKVSAVEAERSQIDHNEHVSSLQRFTGKIQSFFSWVNSSNQQWKSLINGVLHY